MIPGAARSFYPYRLITSILDPTVAPAKELAVLYCHRWEFETANDVLKTHLRGAGIILRSKLPDRVRQEVYAYFLTHYAIRALMYEAADRAQLDPDRLSFINALRVVRRRIVAQSLFSPGRVAAPSRDHAARDLGGDPPPRRLRANPRVVKRKMSKFHVKGPPHRNWPQPFRNHEEAVRIA